MAISWADTPLGESSAATMVHVVNLVKLTIKMMNFCVGLFSYLGNSLGITLVLKHPSFSRCIPPHRTTAGFSLKTA
jgi:hypothetical protein